MLYRGCTIISHLYRTNPFFMPTSALGLRPWVKEIDHRKVESEQTSRYLAGRNNHIVLLVNNQRFKMFQNSIFISAELYLS